MFKGHISEVYVLVIHWNGLCDVYEHKTNIIKSVNYGQREVTFGKDIMDLI